ncbi:MAG: lysophospholipase [Candidatus Marinimicrobia bacterium]|nr:lysophospholipase [Candidatus Neomarinimicrobiota bacterium]MCF7851105.1 lysophospholipase [Candidatus Neomarinimicrobiota bacterium]MCF7904347.1 lysophospholipase [Candidatus Neomarinimicrobiota bacterium]
MNDSVHMHETTFETIDGFSLYECSWLLDEPKGIVLICHGIAEHCGRYDHVARSLCEAGYGVVAFDLRGHGKSSGKRNYVDSFSDYLDDLGEVLDRLKKTYPGIPVFLMGHSMGGGIVTLFAMERHPDVKGLLLSAPSAKVSDDLSPLLQKISGILSALAPKLPAIKLDNSFISKDPKVREAYDSDPLNYRKGILARTGAEVLKSTKQISEGCNAIEEPILIMHGTEDKLADMSGSEMLYEKVASKDKTLKRYEGLYHEILNEPEQDIVKADIIQWLDDHI